ncbi:hypothetical protein IL306_003313 [Fusarium sp. DS 682]|nr:hypothetical protein IL306_003313 [Fusarium sp. DS 682]
MHGWAVLESSYKDLRDFFVDFLGVKTLTLPLVYNELLQLGSSKNATVEQVKANIWALNDLLPVSSERPDVSKLLSSKILPVKYPQKDESFSRLELGNSLYQTLKSTQVYETDGIASTLALSVGGVPHEVEQSRCELHIRDDGPLLEVFVPRDKRSQESCYARKLPLCLSEWLMDNLGRSNFINEKAQRVTASILNSSCSVARMILEDEGIALGDIEEPESEGDDSFEEPLPAENSHGGRHRPGVVQYPMPTSPRGTSSWRSTSPSNLEETSSTQATDHFSIPPKNISYYVPGASAMFEAETRQYRALLQQVVEAARQTVTLPSQGTFSMAGMSSALTASDESYDGLDSLSRFKSTSQVERDKKIGVAGELYVFELLKSLEPKLPGFALNNWKSTLRHYAQAHPEYAEIQSPSGRETSDLIYDDVEGVLTKLLIDNGYLSKEEWENERPRYLLEVKSTTGPCHAPFFVSKRQYQRIYEHQHDKKTIYVILRVYDIGKPSVSLRLYVNPAELEATKKELVFTAETLSVTSTA